jgi:hypothetical protein
MSGAVLVNAAAIIQRNIGITTRRLANDGCTA